MVLAILIVPLEVFRHHLLQHEVRHHEDPGAVDQPELHLDEEGPLLRPALAVDVEGGDGGDNAHDHRERNVDPEQFVLDRGRLQPRRLTLLADHLNQSFQ